MANDPLTFLKSYIDSKRALQQQRQFDAQLEQRKQEQEAARQLQREQMTAEQERWVQSFGLQKQQAEEARQQRELANQAKVGELLASGAFKQGEAQGDVSAQQGIADVLGFGQVPQAATPKVAMPGAVPMYGTQLVPVPEQERMRQQLEMQRTARTEQQLDDWNFLQKKIATAPSLTEAQKNQAMLRSFDVPMDKDTVETMYTSVLKEMRNVSKMSPEARADLARTYTLLKAEMDAERASRRLSSFVTANRYSDLRTTKAKALATMRSISNTLNANPQLKTNAALWQTEAVKLLRTMIANDPDLGPTGDPAEDAQRQGAIREAFDTIAEGRLPAGRQSTTAVLKELFGGRQ